MKGVGLKLTNNQINYWRYKEDSRHNKVTEMETERHNRFSEGEERRHNVVSEGEVLRHNQVTENEINRHNFETENLTREQLYELKRHNAELEGLDYSRIQLGYAQVGLGYSQLDELRRSNIANEQIRSRANEITDAYNQGLLDLRGQELEISSNSQRESVRHNQAMEAETAIHNRQMEQIGLLNANASQTQAEAALTNAGANQQNADTNRRNSNINLLNTVWSNVTSGVDKTWSNFNDSVGNVIKLID